ncbi:MAG: MmgE/PrpD family protein [Deltaproteobacteria bacterium]|nr:MmgE/PrpD family protein [Deltaproteobacteria bacterium]
METEQLLSHYVAETPYEEIPSDVVEMTKLCILDTVACGLAGSTAPGVREVVELAQELGGRPESTIMYYGGKISSPYAAFANSTMCHARDFDDTHDRGVIHAFVNVMPAVLAASERRGGVSGREIIAACALGADLACRLALAVTFGPGFEKTQPGFLRTTVCGIFGAAAGAARALGLDANGVHHAMGIVYSQTGGNKQCVTDASLVKRMQPALAAQGGVFAALLAQRGITGAAGFLEGLYGMFNLYWGGAFNRDELLGDLGRRYELMNLSFKPYPSCRHSHGAIEAILKIVQEHPLKPDDVDRVVVHMSKHKFYDNVSRPFAVRGNPQVDAQFSIPYAVGAALLRKDVFLDVFEEPVVRSPEFQQMAAKVEVVADHEIVPGSLGPVTVEVFTRHSQRYTSRVDEFKGHPENPMSREEILDKFQKCSTAAFCEYSAQRVRNIADGILGLEELRSVEDLMVLLGGK